MNKTGIPTHEEFNFLKMASGTEKKTHKSFYCGEKGFASAVVPEIEQEFIMIIFIIILLFIYLFFFCQRKLNSGIIFLSEESELYP